MKKIIVLIISIVIILPITIYIINPSGTASLDPRARIVGYVTYNIPSRAMAPTLLPNDFMLVSTYAYFKKQPDTNEVIVFKYPEDRRINFVKRVIATAGQTVRLSNGKVLVDGKAISQDYIDPDNNRLTTMKSFESIKVPENMLFVLGDNRDNSRDSRYWGFVPVDDVIGRVTMIWASDDTSRAGKSVK